MVEYLCGPTCVGWMKRSILILVSGRLCFLCVDFRPWCILWIKNWIGLISLKKYQHWIQIHYNINNEINHWIYWRNRWILIRVKMKCYSYESRCGKTRVRLNHHRFNSEPPRTPLQPPIGHKDITITPSEAGSYIPAIFSLLISNKFGRSRADGGRKAGGRFYGVLRCNIRS